MPARMRRSTGTTSPIVESASRSFMATRAQATFCGHVHVPALFHLSLTGKFAGFEPVKSVEIPLSHGGAGSR